MVSEPFGHFVPIAVHIQKDMEAFPLSERLRLPEGAQGPRSVAAVEGDAAMKPTLFGSLPQWITEQYTGKKKPGAPTTASEKEKTDKQAEAATPEGAQPGQKVEAPQPTPVSKPTKAGPGYTVPGETEVTAPRYAQPEPVNKPMAERKRKSAPAPGGKQDVWDMIGISPVRPNPLKVPPPARGYSLNMGLGHRAR
jgi:hypothetical protein